MRKNVWIALSIFLFVALVLVFNHTLPVFGFLEEEVQSIYRIPKKKLYALTAGSQNSTNVKVQQLEQENRQLTEKLVDYQRLKDDNLALKTQIENTSVPASHLLHADVVGFLGNQNTPDALVLDVGESQGIKKDMTVIYGKNLVGTITSVLGQYSVVTLLTSPNFTALGKTVPNGTLGIVHGAGGFIDFEQVVITDPLSVQDIVVTRGGVGADGVGMLPDLIIGKITSISRVASQSFQRAKIVSMLDFAKLSTVFVIAQ